MNNNMPPILTVFAGGAWNLAGGRTINKAGRPSSLQDGSKSENTLLTFLNPSLYELCTRPVNSTGGGIYIVIRLSHDSVAYA